MQIFEDGSNEPFIFLSHDVAPLRAEIIRAKILTLRKENPGLNVVTKVNEQELHFRLLLRS